jgi:selenide,water dikinase
MPIVDDPYEFGKIASANAISDIYAMGGKPSLAIAILGWPINILSPEIARKVIEGSREICKEAGIPLAGGHSIDSPEPIFGLAVNGLVEITRLKQNSTAQLGDILFLTKPLGIGIYTTAEKKGILKTEHRGLAAKQMMQLNKIGEELSGISQVHAMTDITGFGLLGHLSEMCTGSNLSAHVDFTSIPLMPDLEWYFEQDSIPGGTHRNWNSYGYTIAPLTDFQKVVLSDPQTSGGLLISVSPSAQNEVKELFQKNFPSVSMQSIGYMEQKGPFAVRVSNG